jgi:hypothetical protein
VHLSSGQASVDANVILGAGSLLEPQKSPNPAEANANPVSFQGELQYSTEGESWIYGESPKTRSLRRKAVRSTTPAGFERDRHPRRGAAVPIDNQPS